MLREVIAVTIVAGSAVSQSASTDGFLMNTRADFVFGSAEN